MNTKIIIGAVVVVLLGLLFTGKASVNVGSVAIGNEYHATTTYSKLGTPLFGVNQTLVSNTSGTLGSVVITGAVAGSMKFMDATSTTDVSSTTIMVFPASAAANTYTVDLTFFRGLIVESTSALLPTTTITYRSN